jgi:hypothetical protein
MDFFSWEKWAERYNKCCFVSRKNKRIQNTKQNKTSADYAQIYNYYCNKTSIRIVIVFTSISSIGLYWHRACELSIEVNSNQFTKNNTYRLFWPCNLFSIPTVQRAVGTYSTFTWESMKGSYSTTLLTTGKLFSFT